MVLAAAVVMLLPQPAEAGGSWLKTDREYFSVGDHVVARGTFGTGSLEGKVSDGPFYAYLTPGDRAWDDPLAEEAINLGPLTITKATGQYCCWVAEVEFTVPDVPVGRYRIDYCNDPCTVDGIGDLIGGMIFVGDTEREARFAARLERARARVDRLRERLDQAAQDVATPESRADLPGDPEARVAPATPQISRTPPGERPVIGIEGATLIAGALLVFSASLVLRHRESKRHTASSYPIVRKVEVPPATAEGPEDSRERSGAESLAPPELSRDSRPLART
ncbi:MAG: hypothetical protein ACRDI0_03015 [Actinomycetota bacterium]